MNIYGPAGAIDRQFGATSVRQLPPGMIVETTGAFDPATGYPWAELRIIDGVVTAPDPRLVGDMAFDVGGSESIPVGTRCMIAVDREQTAYDLWVAPDPASVPYKPPSSPGTECVVWYTGYLHLNGVTVSEGESLAPGQLIGHIGYHPSGAHLHLSLGDGKPLFSDGGAIQVGQTEEIDSWVTALGVTVSGTHTGTPPDHAADFTGPQLTFIQSRFDLPVEGSGWLGNISSPLHSGVDYYAIDFAFDFGTPNQDAIGEPVFVAVTGDDILTDVVWVGEIAGAGWGVVLRHQQSGCPPPDQTDQGPTSCPVYRTVCEGGYLSLYRCNSHGVYVFDRSMHIPCRPEGTTDYVDGTGPTVIQTEKACPIFWFFREVTGDYDVAFDGDGIINADATTGGLSVVLPDPEDPLLPAPRPPGRDGFFVKKVDSSGNAVTVSSMGGKQVEFGSSYTLAAQGDCAEFYHDGVNWFKGTAPGQWGMKVQRQMVTIYAESKFSPTKCYTNLEDCCPDEDHDIVDDVCCPEGSRVATIEASYSGPLGTDGATCTGTWNLTREDGFVALWAGLSAVGTSACDAVSVYLRVWCQGTDGDGWEWLVAGYFTDGGGNHPFGPLALTDDCHFLTADIPISESGDPLTVVIERPCPGTVTYDCTEGEGCHEVCGGGGAYATLAECQENCTIATTDCGCTLNAYVYKVDVPSGVLTGTSPTFCDCDLGFGGKTFHLTYAGVSGSCLWTDEGTLNPWCIVANSASLGYVVSGTYPGGAFILQFGNAGAACASYVCLAEDFNCLTGGVFTYTATPGDLCADWPATLTVYV